MKNSQGHWNIGKVLLAGLGLAFVSTSSVAYGLSTCTTSGGERYF